MNIKNEYKNIFNKLSKISGLVLITITVIFIISCIQFNNPDYVTYKIMFQTDQRSTEFRTFFYYLITNFLNNFITYTDFRFILVLLQSISFLVILKKFKFKLENISFFTSLPIVIFFILKVHIQIRECIALLIWFTALLEFNKDSIPLLKKVLFPISSLLIHPSTTILWVPTFICSINEKYGKLKKQLISLFFFILATYIFSSGIKNYIFTNYPIIMNFFNVSMVDLSSSYYQNITINSFKILYWISYSLIFVLIYIDEKRKNSILFNKENNLEMPYIFGSISIFGLLSFIPTVWILGFLKGVTGPEYNLIFRLTYILFLILSFYRSLIYPKSILTYVLNFTIFGDMLRLFF